MMRSTLLRVFTGLTVTTATLPASASAQWSAAIEGIGSRIGYDGAGDLSAILIGPVLDWSSPSASLSASGGFAQFEGGGWTLQGAAAGTKFAPFGSHFGAEIGGATVGSTHQDGTTAGAVLGRGRLHWMGSWSGVWAGGALGQAWDGVEWQRDRKIETGAWLRHSTLTLVAEATPTWVGDNLQYVDAELTASIVRRQLDLTASGGIRQWSRAAGVAGSGWGSVGAALWIAPHLALVAGGGSYPADYGQGLRSGSYFSLGLRLAFRRLGRDTPAPIDAPLSLVTGKLQGPARRTGPISSFELHSDGGGQQRFLVRASNARRIQLAGDFTLWQPVTLTRSADGSWQVTLPVPPGLHRINIRVDDGKWEVPPGLPAIADDFGGAVGILQITGF
jgi:Glycogen recognition site of AMP-activated protein kinase